jgi:hypothetical protein
MHTRWCQQASASKRGLGAKISTYHLLDHSWVFLRAAELALEDGNEIQRSLWSILAPSYIAFAYNFIYDFYPCLEYDEIMHIGYCWSVPYLSITIQPKTVL